MNRERTILVSGRTRQGVTRTCRWVFLAAQPCATTDAMETISTCPVNPKQPDSPTRSPKRKTDESDGLESYTDTLNVCIHVHSGCGQLE